MLQKKETILSPLYGPFPAMSDQEEPVLFQLDHHYPQKFRSPLQFQEEELTMIRQLKAPFKKWICRYLMALSQPGCHDAGIISGYTKSLNNTRPVWQK
jgi:hypothetical protein